MTTRATVISDTAFSGHVNVAAGCAVALEENGLDVQHLVIDPQAELESRLAELEGGGLLIQCLIPPLLKPRPGFFNIALVFHEWSRMPDAWIDGLGRFDRVWVASRYNADVLRHSGYHGPLDQIPVVLEAVAYQQKGNWNHAGPFRFLSVGEWHFRKGFHLLSAAFERACGEDTNVELHIKTSEATDYQFEDSRIRLLTDRLSNSEMRRLYADYDAYITTSLAEGLGLPVGEAMAAALPVAAINWGGLTEFTGPGRSLDIPFRLTDQPFCSRPDFFAPGQQCALAELDSAAAILNAMRSMSSEGRRQLAERGQAHIRRHFSLEQAVEDMKNILESMPGE